MFDHVTIRVSDLAASRAFYDLALYAYDRRVGDGFEWNDFSIAPAREGKPVTQGLHVGFHADSRDEVDSWWRRLTDAGYESDGEPGVRPEYSPHYYGAFVLDPDGNSVESMINEPPRTDEIDHLWIRVRDIEASRAFY